MRSVKFFLLIVFVSLIGCAPQKQLVVKIPQNANIGIMYLLDDKAKHVHVGTTMFSNFNRIDVSDWSVRQILIAYINKEFSSKQSFSLFEIEPTSVLMENRNNLYKLGWSRIYLKEEFVPEILKATKDFNIDFMVMIEPFYGQVEPNCTVRSDGYGLLTHCAIGLCYAKGLNHVTSKVYAMDPPRVISWSESLTYHSSDIPIEIDFSNGVKELNISEIDKAKEPVIEFIKNRISSAIERSTLIDESNKDNSADVKNRAAD